METVTFGEEVRSELTVLERVSLHSLRSDTKPVLTDVLKRRFLPAVVDVSPFQSYIDEEDIDVPKV